MLLDSQFRPLFIIKNANSSICGADRGKRKMTLFIAPLALRTWTFSWFKPEHLFPDCDHSVSSYCKSCLSLKDPHVGVFSTKALTSSDAGGMATMDAFHVFVELGFLWIKWNAIPVHVGWRVFWKLRNSCKWNTSISHLPLIAPKLWSWKGGICTSFPL